MVPSSAHQPRGERIERHERNVERCSIREGGVRGCLKPAPTMGGAPLPPQLHVRLPAREKWPRSESG